MNLCVARWAGIADPALRRWWARRAVVILRSTIAIMAAVATVWLGYEGWRLLWQQGYWGAIDLKTYHKLTAEWFMGRPIYGQIKTAVHPPATYAILWPLLGWEDFILARWLWALTSIAALGWLVLLIISESKAETALERAFVVLLPLSMYATGATLGNGQLTIHLVPLLLTALRLLYRSRSGWRREIGGALLFLLALVKPSVSVPFFWIVLFCAGNLRPAVAVALGYLGLTLFVASFQPHNLGTLLWEWLANPALGQPGQMNLRAWLVDLGFKEWALPGSVLVLGVLGFWTYQYRRVNLWLLLGVTALVARTWMYHRWYDDLLILLPMVTLFRIAKAEPSDGSDLLAGILLGITVLAMLAPGGLYLLPPPWNGLYTAGQTLIWIILLIFFLNRAWHHRRGDWQLDS
jgi:hypothetical protein